MTLHVYEDLEQGTDEWLAARRGVVTASVVGELISTKTPEALEFQCPTCDADIGTPCQHVKTRQPIKTIHQERAETARRASENEPPRLVPANNDESRGLTALLVSERITGWSDPSYFNGDMARGHDIEPIARDWYAQKYGPVDEVGFMVEDKWGFRLGFSPDGLIGSDGILEVKAPRAKSHLMTHLSGEVPLYHMAQIQAGLLVSDRDYCEFISYYAGMPPFLKRVDRDEKWGEVIVEAVQQFETKAAEMQAEYAAITADIPTTERLLIDMEMSF